MSALVAVEALSALAQPARLAVFRQLVQAGAAGLAAGEVARRLRIPGNTMSTQLAILSRAGLIHSRREGRSIRYFADFAILAGLLSFLVEDCCQGAPQICAPLQAMVSRVACCPAETPVTPE